MGRPTKQNFNLSKKEILKKALQLLDKKGHKALTFRTLAFELGVTPMAIAYHVGTREEMLSSMISQVYDKVGEVSVEKPPVERLRHILTNYCKKVLQHPQLTQCIFENPFLITSQLTELTELIRSNLITLVSHDEVDTLLNLIIDYTHGFALSTATEGIKGPSIEDYLQSLNWVLTKCAD